MGINAMSTYTSVSSSKTKREITKAFVDPFERPFFTMETKWLLRFPPETYFWLENCNTKRNTEYTDNRTQLTTNRPVSCNFSQMKPTNLDELHGVHLYVMACSRKLNP